MKVLMIIAQYYPVIGGAEIQAKKISEYLIKRGISVSVLTVRKNSRLKFFEEINGVKVYRLKYVRIPKIGKYLLLLNELFWLLTHGKRFNIYHCHQGLGFSSIAVLTSRIFKKPSIVKISNTGDRFDFRVLKRTYLIGFLLCKVFNYAEKIIYLNEKMRQQLEKEIKNTDKLIKIYNGVDTERFKPPERDEKVKLKGEMGIDKESILITYSGTIQKKKNLRLLIKMSEILRDKKLNFKILIVGNGPERENLINEVKLRKLDKFIIFTGKQENVEKFLFTSDIFVLPSFVEGLSNSLLEACSCGLACVVSDIPGNREIVKNGQNGFLASPYSPEEFAEKIENLIKNPELIIKMGETSRKIIEERFSLSKIVEEYLKLYRRLTGKNKEIKICYVIGTLIPGGAEKQLLNLIKFLDKTKFRPVLIALRKGELEQSFKKIVKVEVVGKKWKIDLFFFYRLLKLIKQEKPEILHTFMFTSNTWGRIVGILCGVPVIIASERSMDLWKKWYHFKIDRILGKFTDKIICVSKEIKNFYQKKTGLEEKKFAVIENGVLLEEIEKVGEDENLRKTFGIKENDFVILTGGRLCKEKAIDVLIEIVPELKKKIENLKILIAGEGEEKEKLTGLVKKLKVEENIVFTGYRKDILKIIKISDIVVLASKWEGMPNLILEGMALKKAVICTNIGGSKELIKNGVNGFLVEFGNKKNLKERIIYLYHNPQIREKMGEKGYEIVREKFNLIDKVKKYESIYLGLMKTKE